MVELEKILKRSIVLQDIQQRQIPERRQWCQRYCRSHLPQGPRLVKRRLLPPKQGSPILRGRRLTGDPGSEPCRAIGSLAHGRRSTNSCSKTVAPSGPKRHTDGIKQPAPNSATPNSLTYPSARTARPALWQKRGTAGSQPQPVSYKISRKLAWSTGTEGFGTRWATIRGTSSAST